MTIRKKILFRWAKVLILIYCLIGIVVYYWQDSLLFHPVPVDRKAAYQFGQPFTEVNVPYDNLTNLNVIEFKTAADSVRGVVLYFHGNAKNVQRYAAYAADFTRNGYEVWMMDYPGFGKSTGKFSEEALYKYALVVYKLARSRWAPNQIVLYGRSLGTGVAAQLADVRDCRRLILECPYYSMTSLVRHYLPLWPVGTMLHYTFPTYEYLPQVTAPVTIFHGTSDGVVSYSNAERLKPLLKAGDEFITVEGAGHNDMHAFPEFTRRLDSLLSK